MLLISIGLRASNQSDNPDSLGLEYAKSLLQNVSENGNVSNLIDNTVPTILPFAINKKVAEKDIAIVLDSISFTPEGGMVTAYTAIEDMKSKDTTLAFKVSKAVFTPNGFTGDARLKLINDVPVKLFNSTVLTFKKNGTYIDWDCKGFKDLGISCEVSFDTNFIVREKPDGTTTGQKVSTSFQTQIKSWNNLIVDINLPPFQFKKLKGFGFYVSHAVLDLSETTNSLGTVFPKGYRTPSMPEVNSPLWQGFSLQQFTVKLPPEFKKNNSNERITFSAKNVLIDEQGFTGDIFAYNLLSLENGTADGWAFSVDTLNVEIKTNDFQNVKLAGEIQLPITDSSDAFRYSGFIDNAGNYFLNVNMKKKMAVPLWSAQMNLYDDSRVQMYEKDNKLVVSALLNGELSIKNENIGAINIAGIKFQGLKLQTEKPYMDIAVMSLATSNQGKMANFPVSLYDIKFQKKNTDVGLGTKLAINLVGDKEHGFSANGGFTIWGELQKNNGRTKYKYKNISFDEIKIDVDAGAYAFKGLLNIYKQNPIYGNGFKGAVKASFLPGFSVSTTAQFGNINNYRYWYVDGLVAFPGGIPIMQSGLGLYGFGGGAYYHMRRTNSGNIEIPTDSLHNNDTSQGTGMSLSGVTYLPDKSVYLGVKASTIIGTFPKPDAFNSMSTFEINFNTTGGVRSIGFQGDAYFMTPLNKRGSNSKMYAKTDISYDFDNKILHGQTSVFVNIPHLVVGANQNNLAGISVIHIEPTKWQITVGTPLQRVALRIMDKINFSSYFMIGNDIPALPSLPSNVSIIEKDLNRNINTSELASGDGFIVGASLNVNINQKYWLFYGKFNAGCGFDMMLKNYGIGTHCSGCSEPIGFNGWYAQGQAYAYLQGNLGINISKGIFAGNYSIMDLAAATVLQAKFPNPTWLQGNISGHYSIFGGVIEGKCNYKFTIGKQCEFVGATGLEGMNLIAGLSPSDASEDVDVFTSPQASFNMKINKIFQFEDINKNKKIYRVAFDYFKVKCKNKNIRGHLVWNSKGDVVVFEPEDILPGKTKVNIETKVHFQQKINGVWKNVYKNGKLVSETKKSVFSTGIAPDYIRPDNVAYSYPMKRQLNFYPDEADTGYIQLKRGQDNLFAQNRLWIQKGEFVGASDSVEFDFTYDNKKNRINFLIPKTLKNNEIYKLALLKIPTQKNVPIDKNVKDTTINISGISDNSMKIRKKQIQGNRINLQEKKLYAIYLRTSYYNTFSQKIDAMQFSAPWSWPIMNGVHKIGLSMTNKEYFDSYEINGGEDFVPLVQLYTDTDNEWFEQKVDPLMYSHLKGGSSSGFPQDVYISWRNTNSIGVPPVKTSVLILPSGRNKLLTNNEIAQNFYSDNTSFVSLENNIDYYVYKDYNDLCQKAGCSNGLSGNDALKKLLETPYPSMLSGYPNYYYYKVEIKYFLPGKKMPNSSKTIKIGY
jgi:hypothetical protein